LSIGHVSPESAEGGAIALVRDGDIIDIDIPKRRIHLAIAEVSWPGRREAMEARGAEAWSRAKRQRKGVGRVRRMRNWLPARHGSWSAISVN